ncbi:hypothetical protein EZS27_020630 [termite gut metagenome]|jgi:hypothetical protein|uniref:Uncharacterized protein n=1 Tax=termite gut metagenome TaxID=433724 RepID=A0A5J4RAB8_9ZZZZ
MKKAFNLPFIWELRKITLYFLFTIKALRKFKKASVLSNAFSDFPIWWKSIKRNLNPLDYDRPWITFEAKNFLDSILNSKMSVFEYGAGCSTLYFSRRVKAIYSVENNKEWFESLNKYIKENRIDNVNIHLVEGISTNEINTTYSSLSSDYRNINFEDYVKVIDTFPDMLFDIILVDGRARAGCIKHAVTKLKKGGYLIVDNSERKEYFRGNDYLFDPYQWSYCAFIGAIPFAFEFSQTSFFQKKY